MTFNIGDLVTRKSYNNDVIFKIININEMVAYLKGINVRLCADSIIDDLEKCEKPEEEVIELSDRDVEIDINLNRDEYFYLPGKVLHIDGDKEYLKRCMNFYKKNNILAYGYSEKEEDIPEKVVEYYLNTGSDIIVITGHDSYNKEKNTYKNSSNFIRAVKELRKKEKAQDKLIIIAGACGSNYEELIRSGANFASSPKRINIHALDPAIIATKVSLSLKNEDIDLLGILSKTKYGVDGMGGIKTKGTMYIGFPR